MTIATFPSAKMHGFKAKIRSTSNVIRGEVHEINYFNISIILLNVSIRYMFSRLIMKRYIMSLSIKLESKFYGFMFQK